MNARYLLPCRCGQHVVVEPRQAGQTIVCGCGASLQVPTLLDMTVLDPAPPEPAEPASGPVWGFRDGMRLVGIVLVLTAIVFLLLLKRPVSRFETIDPEQIRMTAERLSPVRTWEIWETMQQGLDRRTDEQHMADVQKFHLRQVIWACVALVGLGLIAASAAGGMRRGPRNGVTSQ